MNKARHHHKSLCRRTRQNPMQLPAIATMAIQTISILLYRRVNVGYIGTQSAVIAEIPSSQTIKSIIFIVFMIPLSKEL